MPGILRIVDGCVYEYNQSGQRCKIFYTGKDATRADWIENESIQVWLRDGKVYLINRGGQIYKRFL